MDRLVAGVCIICGTAVSPHDMNAEREIVTWERLRAGPTVGPREGTGRFKCSSCATEPFNERLFKHL